MQATESKQLAVPALLTQSKTETVFQKLTATKSTLFYGLPKSSNQSLRVILLGDYLVLMGLREAFLEDSAVAFHDTTFLARQRLLTTGFRAESIRHIALDLLLLERELLENETQGEAKDPKLARVKSSRDVMVLDTPLWNVVAADAFHLYVTDNSRFLRLSFAPP